MSFSDLFDAYEKALPYIKAGLYTTEDLNNGVPLPDVPPDRLNLKLLHNKNFDQGHFFDSNAGMFDYYGNKIPLPSQNLGNGLEIEKTVDYNNIIPRKLSSSEIMEIQNRPLDWYYIGKDMGVSQEELLDNLKNGRTLEQRALKDDSVWKGQLNYTTKEAKEIEHELAMEKAIYDDAARKVIQINKGSRPEDAVPFTNSAKQAFDKRVDLGQQVHRNLAPYQANRTARLTSHDGGMRMQIPSYLQGLVDEGIGKAKYATEQARKILHFPETINFPTPDRSALLRLVKGAGKGLGAIGNWGMIQDAMNFADEQEKAYQDYMNL